MEPLLIEAADLGGHLPVVELPGASFFSLVTPGFPQVRSLGQLDHRFGKSRNILRRDQSAGNAIEDDFACAIDIEADCRDAAQECLREGTCQALTKAAVGQEITGAQIVRHMLGRD